MLINNVNIEDKEIMNFSKELKERSDENFKLTDGAFKQYVYTIEYINENRLLNVYRRYDDYSCKIATIYDDLNIHFSKHIFGYEQSIIKKISNYIENKHVYRPQMQMVDMSLMLNLVNGLRNYFGRYYAIDLVDNFNYLIVRLDISSLDGSGKKDVDIAQVSFDGDVINKVDKNSMVYPTGFNELDYIENYVKQHKHESKIDRYASINYQTGTEQANGVNGLQINDIIDIVKRRLKELDSQKSCLENTKTMEYLELAQQEQNIRDDRIANVKDAD